MVGAMLAGENREGVCGEIWSEEVNHGKPWGNRVVGRETNEDSGAEGGMGPWQEQE